MARGPDAGPGNPFNPGFDLDKELQRLIDRPEAYSQMKSASVRIHLPPYSLC